MQPIALLRPRRQIYGYRPVVFSSRGGKGWAWVGHRELLPIVSQKWTRLRNPGLLRASSSPCHSDAERGGGIYDTKVLRRCQGAESAWANRTGVETDHLTSTMRPLRRFRRRPIWMDSCLLSD